ncbi:type IV pilus biogenesis/stability protein PilW [Halomonas shantousis]
MLRRRSPLIRSLSAVLFAVLVLSGCATQVNGSGPYSTASNDDAVAAYTQLGLAYLRRNNLSRAQDALEHALALGPRDAEALEGMALLYQRQDESELADAFFRRALENRPDYTRARNNYAAFLYDQGRLDAACEQLEHAVQDVSYSNRARLFANLGQCRYEQGRIEAARRSLERAQALDSRETRSLLILARLEHAQGNEAKAWEQLQRYFTLAGTSPDSLRLAHDIAQAQGDDATAHFYLKQLSDS